jgi:hypothetical protein
MDAMDADTVENPAASADEAAAADGPGVVDEEQLDVAAMAFALQPWWSIPTILCIRGCSTS